MEKKKLFRYNDFVNENQTKEKEETTTIPKPVIPKPSIINPNKPSIEDDPMAYAKHAYGTGTKEKEETTTIPKPVIPKPVIPKPSIINPNKPSIEDDPMAELNKLYPGEVYAASEDGTIFVGDVNTKTKDPAKALEYMNRQPDPEAQAHMGDNKLEESRKTNRRRK
jgi:hypothetical protein